MGELTLTVEIKFSITSTYRGTKLEAALPSPVVSLEMATV
jgi:hypothetical protein